MDENKRVANLLADHYQAGRKELAEYIIKTIEKRKDKSDIGTLTRIYSYCKKQIKQNINSESGEGKSMIKPITLPLPKCKKCGKILEPQFTTEKEEGDNSKPEVLMFFGICKDCKMITMCNIIETKDLLDMKDLRDVKLGANE